MFVFCSHPDRAIRIDLKPDNDLHLEAICVEIPADQGNVEEWLQRLPKNQ